MKKDEKKLPAKKADVKKYTIKKLPGIFKKTYSEKKLNKKILNKIYIPSDKEKVKALFERGANEKRLNDFAVSGTNRFSKKELKQLKLIAKDIKGQKGRFKLLPLVAVIVFIAAAGVVISVFKNPIAKKIVKSSCEAIFSAKTDIDSVNVEILGASFTVNHIVIGNKDSVMKNLFEADKIEFDFNLTQALLGKFDAENLEVSGMAFGTDRKTSCELPAKVKKEKKKAEKSDSKFVKSLKEKSNKAIDDLRLQVETMLGGSDVESIAANIQNQLKTPAVSQNVTEEVYALSVKWQSKPLELKKDVDEFSNSVNDLKSLEVSKISDVAALKSSLEKINAAIESGNSLGKSISSVSNELKADSQKVSKYSDELSNAIKADSELAKNLVGSVADTVKNAKQIMTNALDTIGYDMLGKYYPYARKLINYAFSIKTQSQNKAKASGGKKEKPKSVKKENSRRLAGTTLWFKAQNPSFLIRRIYLSGTGFSAEGTEITNDQDVRGKPMTLKGTYVSGTVSHGANFVIDARSASKAPLLQLEYTGRGFEVNVDGEKIAENSGIPSVAGKANITLSGSAGTDSFSAKGSVSVLPCSFTSAGFGNELVDKYYIQALESVKNLSLGYAVNYTESNGLNLDLTGNYGDVFANALKSVASSAGADAQKALADKINETVNDSSNEAFAKIKEFTGIESDVNVQVQSFESVQKQLDAKRAEIEKKIKDSASSAAKSAASNAASGLLKGLKK